MPLATCCAGGVGGGLVGGWEGARGLLCSSASQRGATPAAARCNTGRSTITCGAATPKQSRRGSWCNVLRSWRLSACIGPSKSHVEPHSLLSACVGKEGAAGTDADRQGGGVRGARARARTQHTHAQHTQHTHTQHTHTHTTHAQHTHSTNARAHNTHAHTRTQHAHNAHTTHTHAQVIRDALLGRKSEEEGEEEEGAYDQSDSDSEKGESESSFS